MAEFCTVKRALHAYQVDGPDEDADPDMVMVQGKITFTPLLGKGDVITMVEDGQPVSVVPRPITARVSNGVIMHRGREGVRLLAGGVQMRPEQIRYRASFSEMQAGGWAFTVRNVDFVAKPGGEVDLTLVGPVANMPDGNNRGPMGAGITDVHVDGSELVVIVTDEDGSRELSRLPLDDVVRAEADAAAKVAADAVRDDLAATLGDAGESAAAADASAKAAAASAKGSADSATAAAGSASDAGTAKADAETAQGKVEAAQGKAEEAAAAAASDRLAAGAARDAAQSARSAAEDARDAAASSASSAASDADRAEAAAELSDGAAVKAVTEKVDELTKDAPEKFDTLKEIADALEAQEDMGAVLTSQIAGKADKKHTHVSADISDAVSSLGDGAGNRLVKTGPDGRVGIPEPVNADHEATKGYVDGRIQLVDALPDNPDPSVLYVVRES